MSAWVVIGIALGAQQQPENPYLARQMAFVEMMTKEVEGQQWSSVKQIVSGYIARNEVNPLLAYHGVEQLLAHPEMLDVAASLNEKAIQANSIEALERLHPQMGTKTKLRWMYRNLYSQQGWIQWKKGRLDSARQSMERAGEYHEDDMLGSAGHLLRAGIVACDVGQHEQGWREIEKALKRDRHIVRRNPDHEEPLKKIVEQRFGEQARLSDVIARIRAASRQKMPEFEVEALDRTQVDLSGNRTNILFVNFFNPACGSCRQEISRLKSLYDNYSGSEEVQFVFILTRPDLAANAHALFKQHGIAEPLIVKLKSGSAYNFIEAEPTIWIVDKEQHIVDSHVGYEEGGEKWYALELDEAISAEH